MKANAQLTAACTALLLAGAIACGDTRYRSRTETGSAERADTRSSAERTETGMSNADRDFMLKAAQGGMAEVEMGKLARDHGGSDAVKRFGDRLVADHSKANDELRDVASKKNVDLPAAMDEKHRDAIDKLGQLRGADFDRKFWEMAVDDHRKDLTEFHERSSSGRDVDIRSFAAKYAPVIEDHLRMAERRGM